MTHPGGAAVCANGGAPGVAVACPDCRVSSPAEGDRVLLIHRDGCPFGAVLMEAEAAGKPVMLATPTFAVRVFSTFEGHVA
jgi:hypothetical protein